MGPGPQPERRPLRLHPKARVLLTGRPTRGELRLELLRRPVRPRLSHATLPLHRHHRSGLPLRSRRQLPLDPGGAFVPTGAFGGAYDGEYLYADFACGKIFHLDPSSPSRLPQEFDLAGNFGLIVPLAFDPTDNSLYFGTYDGGGNIYRTLP